MMVVAVAVAATVAGSMEGIGRACGWGGGVRNAKSRVAKLLCIDKTNEHIRTRVRESPFTHIYPRTPSIPTPHTSHTTQQKRNKTVVTFEFRFSKHLSTRDAVRVAGIWVIQNRTNQVSYHGPYQEPVK